MQMNDEGRSCSDPRLRHKQEKRDFLDKIRKMREIRDNMGKSLEERVKRKGEADSRLQFAKHSCDSHSR